MVNLPVSIPRNILVATLEAGTSTLADPIRRKYAYFTAARRASKQRIRLSGHFWCQKPMARWHHGQPHRRNQPPRAAGRSLSTQNCRRRAGSVPREPPRTRFGAPPTRRWSRFLCYLVRLVAHAPGGLRSAGPPRGSGSPRRRLGEGSSAAVCGSTASGSESALNVGVASPPYSRATPQSGGRWPTAPVSGNGTRCKRT